MAVERDSDTLGVFKVRNLGIQKILGAENPRDSEVNNEDFSLVLLNFLDKPVEMPLLDVRSGRISLFVLVKDDIWPDSAS
jgi:hypothetical protein